jgi:hypothetical protein
VRGIEKPQAVVGGAQTGAGLLVFTAGAQVILVGNDFLGFQLLGPLEIGLGQRHWLCAWR